MIIPYPDQYTSFQSWANDICKQNLNCPMPIGDWQDWGNACGLINVFNNDINPNIFNSWRDWAEKLVVINS
jgi:hypothetical protein